MTIAVGVLAGDGVVLAADTEYTWGYLKTSGEKIWTAEGHGALAIAGAGNGAYLSAIAQQMIDAFKAAPKTISVERLYEKFSEILTDFHSKHVIRFAHLGSSVAISLLVALQRGKEAYLWASENDSLERCGPYASIGLGCEYANALLGEMFAGTAVSWKASVPLAERIAAYAVFETKNNVRECGKKTSLVAIQKGHIVETSAQKMLLINSHLNAFSEIRILGTKYALGFPYPDATSASEKLMAYLGGLRQDVLAIEGQTFEGKGRSLE